MTVIINDSEQAQVSASFVAQAMDIVKLSDTLAMAIYELGGRLKAVTISISDTAVTVNTELDIDPTSGSSDDAVLVALTSTSAMVVYEHNATDVRARILSVSGTTITANAATTLTDALAVGITAPSACFISNTKVLYVYQNNTDTQGNAVVLSVSGTTITENTIITFGTVANNISSTKCAAYSTTRAIVTYCRALGGDNIYGIILSISGNTLTANSEKNIVLGVAIQGIENTYCIQMSSTQVAYGNLVNSGNLLNNYILTLNGTTFDIGAVTTATQTTNGNVSAAKLSNTSLIVACETSADSYEAFKYNITGVSDDELTLDGSDTVTISGLDTIRLAPASSSKVISFHFATSTHTFTISTIANEFTVAPMRKPCDIDADGGFLYIAALDASGNPILIKFNTDLASDGTSVFSPGAGTDIGVQCARFDSNVIYVAGDFGGTNVIEKSSDSGGSFSVIDPATFGTIESFVVGPDTDDRILVSDVTNDDIQESIDGGTTWTAINLTLGFNAISMARLDRNVQEMVLGAESAATLNINYTVNSAADTEDIGTSPFPESDVNGVIIN